MKKLVPIIFGLLILFSIGFVFFQSNQPSKSPATVAEQRTEASISAEELYEAFEQDETEANERFLNKIIEVSGDVVQVEQTELGVKSLHLKAGHTGQGIGCKMENRPGISARRYEIGQSVRLKCICIGLANTVELVQCVER